MKTRERDSETFSDSLSSSASIRSIVSVSISVRDTCTTAFRLKRSFNPIHFSRFEVLSPGSARVAYIIWLALKCNACAAVSVIAFGVKGIRKP